MDEAQIDTYEGSMVQLQCRFPPLPENALSFWLTHTNNNIDNAAFGNRSMSPNVYDVFLNREEGRYDLQIKNVSYERDNGRYECKMKDSNTGVDIYRKYITLTVLKAPSQPTISPTVALAVEGKRLDLQCNTFGGSPEPEVRWYRGDTRTQPLHTGKTLSIEPKREDDGMIYRCVVRNRAMREGEMLEAAVTLNVNYHPRVTVGPANPLKVEVNGTANLECHVDSKPLVREVKWLRENGQFISSMGFQYTISRVTLEDAGKYTCVANNSLSIEGNASLMLDVLYPPTVSIEIKDKEQGQIPPLRIIEKDESETVHCNVSGNPMPSVIEWLREGRPEFRLSGKRLRLTRVTPDQAGNYTCRAINTIHPTGGERKNYSASASVIIRVRHKPGPARLTPDSPIAIEGSRVILTCMASPAGYPEAQYTWWKETGGSPALIQLANPFGPKYEIDSVHLGSEGTYRCNAGNEIGIGEAASVNLTVHQPPKILTKLQPYINRK